MCCFFQKYCLSFAFPRITQIVNILVFCLQANRKQSMNYVCIVENRQTHEVKQFEMSLCWHREIGLKQVTEFVNL